MVFQKPLYKHPHLCTCRISFLPVYRSIFTKCIRQFFCNSNQFFIFIKILNCLRFGKGIIESQLIRCKSKFFSLFLGSLYLPSKVKHFLNYLLIRKHSIEIKIHRFLQNLTKLFRFDHIRVFIHNHLLSNKLLKKFYCEVLLFHIRNLLKKILIEQREFTIDILEEVNHSITVNAGFQQIVDSFVHFRQGYFLVLTLIYDSINKYTDRLKECGFNPLIFRGKRGAKG